MTYIERVVKLNAGNMVLGQIHRQRALKMIDLAMEVLMMTTGRLEERPISRRVASNCRSAACCHCACAAAACCASSSILAANV